MRPSTSTSEPIGFAFALNRKITVLVVLALPLLLSLGFWQLDRAEQKRTLELGFAEQQARAPVSLADNSISQLPLYQRIIAEGQFDNEHTWLLDNKQRRGQVGYEVVSPFRLTGGEIILVNRGWVAAKASRDELPEVTPVNGVQTIFAELVDVSEHPLLDAENTREAWPRVVMAIETKAMAAQLGKPVAPRYLRLDASSAGAFETDWHTMQVGSEKHTGYAVQWFAMALALCIWFVFANSNLLIWWRSRQSH
ncbi:MAG TPA: SURF1 family protein [Cellvibrionaceae bacterium]